MRVCTALLTDSHASTPPLSFLQAGCLSCRLTNSIKALKADKLPSEWNRFSQLELWQFDFIFGKFTSQLVDSSARWLFLSAIWLVSDLLSQRLDLLLSHYSLALVKFTFVLLPSVFYVIVVSLCALFFTVIDSINEAVLASYLFCCLLPRYIENDAKINCHVSFRIKYSTSHVQKLCCEFYWYLYCLCIRRLVIRKYGDIVIATSTDILASLF